MDRKSSLQSVQKELRQNDIIWIPEIANRPILGPVVGRHLNHSFDFDFSSNGPFQASSRFLQAISHQFINNTQTTTNTAPLQSCTYAKNGASDERKNKRPASLFLESTILSVRFFFLTTKKKPTKNQKKNFDRHFASFNCTAKMNKSLLVAAVVIASVVTLSSAQTDLSVCFQAPKTRLGLSADKIRCYDSSNQLITANNAQSCAVYNALPDGIYNCSVNVDPYYPVWSTVSLPPRNGGTYALLYLLPVLPKYGFSVYTISSGDGLSDVITNMSLPDGAYDIPYVSLQNIDNAQYHYGTSGSPARVKFTNDDINLVMASSGVYKVSGEISQNSSKNFDTSSLRVFVFYGTDRENGFVGFYESMRTPEKSWHVGNLVVSEPSIGCSKYVWEEVDSYSNETAHTGTSSGAPQELGQECFDVTPAQLDCLAPVYPESDFQRTCGVFGDPHIVMFNTTGVSCGHQTYITLLDNPYLTLSAQTAIVDVASGATASTNITFEYKAACNPVVISVSTIGAEISAVNAPLADRHTLRVEGNNIYIDAIRLRLQLRVVPVGTGMNTIVFGISIPSALANISTGICAESCPGYEIDTAAFVVKRSTAKALAACDDIADPFAKDACLFDVSTTGDALFADASSAAVALIEEIKTPYVEQAPYAPYSAPPTQQAPSPAQGPTGSPSGSPSAAPKTSQSPSGDASSLAASSALFFAVLALFATLM